METVRTPTDALALGALEAHAAQAVSLGAAAVNAWRAVDAAGVAFHDALRRSVEVCNERLGHAAHVLVARHAGEPMNGWHAQMVNAPRCRGIDDATADAFGRFVQTAADIIGRSVRLEAVLRDSGLAHGAGVDSFEPLALAAAAQLARDFSSAFPTELGDAT